MGSLLRCCLPFCSLAVLVVLASAQGILAIERTPTATDQERTTSELSHTSQTSGPVSWPAVILQAVTGSHGMRILASTTAISSLPVTTRRETREPSRAKWRSAPQ